MTEILEDATPEKSKQLFIESDELTECLQHSSPLHAWFLSLGIPEEHLKKWYVGADLKGKTCFFQANSQSDVVNYRQGVFNESGEQVSKSLYSKRQPEGPDRYLTCLYGEHLLAATGEKTICLVIDERTAVAGAHYYDQYDWLATCGPSMLTDIKMPLLEGKTIYMIRDARVHASRKIERQLQNHQVKYRVVNIMEGHPENHTLADLLASGERPELAFHAEEPEAIKDDIRLPDGVDREEFEKWGFFEMAKPSDTGYYFARSGRFEKVSNFIIKPIFHIYSKTDNKRLIMIRNHRYERILDLPSKYFVSIQAFREAMYSEGNYRFDGTTVHLNRILAKISEQFPLCNELKTLGWQTEGFFAFANGIFDSEFVKADEYGITEHEGNHYFSPSFSDVYKNVREEDDLYEEDRYFVWKKSPVNFEKWAAQVVKVYRENGRIAIAWLIAAVFRDIIYSRYKIFPHLFMFGEKGSGKSQLGWSLNNLFFNGKPGFNLTAGTNVGFFRKLARCRNSVAWYDEYTNTIDPRRFQALKAAYDGMGHEKGVMSRDSRTEVTKVNSGCVISGQYLPTADDNALFQRSVLLSFNKKQYSSAEIKAYDKLKEWEEEGLSSIIGEVLQHRELIAQRFSRVFSEEMASLKTAMGDGDQEERLMRNFACVLTPVKVLEELVNFPFTYEELHAQAAAMLKELSAQIGESEGMSMFWNMVEFLLDNEQILAGVDFKIEGVNSVRVSINRREQRTVEFDQTTKVLFIRFQKIHPLYMEAHRRQHGHNGIDMTSLKHYMATHRAFIGAVKATTFDNSSSSAYAFDYDLLRINLERQAPREAAGHHEAGAKDPDLPF